MPHSIEELCEGYGRIKKLMNEYINREKINYLDSCVPYSKDLAGWERLTDPCQHSEHFRYLVHAVSERSVASSMQMIMICEEMQRDPTLKSEKIDLLRTPEKIAEKRVISTSLIDAQHRETWQGGGYILAVPEGNILQTYSQDCGTLFFKGDETRTALYRERDTKGIADPDSILQYTSSQTYNEVVVTGTGRNGEKVKITGVFIKVFPDGDMVNHSLARELRRVAYSINVPIIEIPESYTPYQKSEPRVFSDGFNYVMGDQLYLFQGEHSSLSVLEYSGKRSRPMKPSERAEMISAVREHLTTVSNPELEALVAKAEQIPDQTLFTRAGQHQSFRQSQLFGDHLNNPFKTNYFLKKY